MTLDTFNKRMWTGVSILAVASVVSVVNIAIAGSLIALTLVVVALDVVAFSIMIHAITKRKKGSRP